MGYIKPDSALVRAATDLVSRHSGQAGGTCAACGEASPCASARHAIEVRRAAGLPDAISRTDPLTSPPVGGGADLLSGSFGSTFAGNPAFGEPAAPQPPAAPTLSPAAPTLSPALAAAGANANVNAGAYTPGGVTNRPVGLSKPSPAEERAS